MEEKKIKVLPVHRKGGWLEQITKNHDGAFMFTGTGAIYSVPETETGNLVNVLEDVTPEEIVWLEKQIGLEPNSLNPNLKKDKNLWRKEKFARVKLTKDGIDLDLRNPYDFIKYLVLRSNKDFVAPSWEERYNKGTYRFAIVDADSEIKEGSKKAETMRDAYMLFGKIEDKESKLKGVLRIYLTETRSIVKLPSKTTRNFLITEVNKIIETNPSKFISIVRDKDFDIKSDLSEAINCGYIIKIGKAKYQFKDMIDESFTYDELVTYLKNPENSDRYITLKEKIK